MFDLKLHGVQGLEGIDEDIQKEIMSEIEPGGETQPEEPKKEEEPAEQSEVKTEEKVQDADADSDKKQSEPAEKDNTVESEDKDKVEGDTIPYKRFKTVNEQRKALRTENEELKRKIEELTKTSSKEKPAEKPNVSQYQGNGFSQEQMEKIYDYAIKQIKDADKLTDEDVEAIKYSDDKVKSMAFEKRVADEVTRTIEGLKDIQKKKADLDTQWQESSKEFSDLNDRIMDREDHEECLNYILKTAFEKETPRKQRCLNESFQRLQSKKGTYQDIELIAAYVNKAEAEYDKGQQKATNVAKKFEKAQGLPKAPNVNGGASTDTNYTIDDINNALDNGEWEKLPKEIMDKILKGESI